MISFKRALKIVINNIEPLNPVVVRLEHSLNKYLAQDIVAKMDLPSYNNSAMDGYGIMIKSLSGDLPKKLKITGVLEAGDNPYDFSLKKDQAVKIMTGAPIPKGVNTVVPVENTKTIGNNVWICKKHKIGDNIRKKGENVRKNELVFKKGRLIRPEEFGMLACLGYSKVKVTRDPKCAVISTGNELVELGKKLSYGKIINSNSYSIQGQIVRYGGIPIVLGIARDNVKELKEKIKKGIKNDILILTGGVSMGEKDLVKQVLVDLGAKMLFWKVAQRPGQPLAFFVFNKKPVFCLPGNPVSSMVMFEEFIRTAILKMRGGNRLGNPEILAIIEDDINVKYGKRYFLRVCLKYRNGDFFAKLTGPQGSGILKSMALSNALLVVPEDTGHISKGTKCKVQLLDIGFLGKESLY